LPVTKNGQARSVLLNAKAKEVLEELRSKSKDGAPDTDSLQAPEVECIGKGKVHTKYEFGCKVSLATTSKDNWIVGAEALHNNPFDGHTLQGALEQVKRLVGWAAQNAYCDKGYQGNPKQLAETTIHLACRRKSSMTPSEWRWFRRRSAIEPVIGHTKEDHRMDRNYLKGTDGDKMNALLAACGFNLRKLLRALLWLVFKELERLKRLLASFKWPDRATGGRHAAPGISLQLRSNVA